MPASLIEEQVTRRAEDVRAVVVAYHPRPGQLDALVEELLTQVGGVIVVDNTDAPENFWSPSGSGDPVCSLVRLGENLGVGYAQNLGVCLARDQGARFVLLLDQDSLPAPSMVALLRRGMCSTTNALGEAPLVAGPVHVDQVTGVRSPLPPSGVTISCADPLLGVVAARLTVASGMLIDVRAFELVGYMREDYFIDWIDIEWVMRLHGAGHFSVGVLEAVLLHNEGEALSSVWFVPGKRIPHHQPFRNYYRVRNQLLIFRDLPVGLGYKLRRVVGLIKYLVYFSVFADRRLARLRFMGLGILHGLLDVRGALNCHLDHPSTRYQIK